MSVAATRPLAFIALVFFSGLTVAQTSPRILVTKPVDENQLTVLKGNTHPWARAALDRGSAPADLPMNRMLLVLKRSDEQESALRSLIDNQQDKTSPNYHKWLTPEQFGKQFGPSDQDIAQVTSWLQSHGFQIAQVSEGRTVIEFSGTAAQVQEALHASIHKYAVNGEEHWANSNDPQIPAALAPVVAGVESLNNFSRKPMYHLGGVVSRSKSTGEMKPLQPFFTIPGSGCGVQSSSCYGVGPYDFATIYNVSSLWSATPAVDGTGETIAIVGETDINPQDVADFRNIFGLPVLTSSQLNIIHNGPDPGILTDGEETESDLNVEWSSAVAKGATIDFVVSESTETTAGIDLSAQYIIDNNLAPVISESYGLCELGLGTAGNAFYNQLWQQAAAQGITVFISSGDSGSAGCDSQDSAPPAPSLFGLAVSGFASTPYNVAVGGTDFNDLTNATTYWSSSNNATTQASALSYIPETTWNDSCTNSVFGTLLGFSASAEANCNNSQLSSFVVTVGGSGGKSNCTNPNGQQATTCAGGYGKPSWQSGSNVPADNVRDIPDVSLFAAAGSPSGSFYIICEADQAGGQNSCNPTNPFTNFLGIGGTSASAPAFAGIMALVNQQTNSRQGNANYVFYKLAANQPGVFNDVTTGTIAMPCHAGSINCTTATAGDQYGVLSGYTTGVGYDLATGLGSVNVANLVNKWNTVSFNASTTTLTSLAPTTITHGQTVSVSVKVAGSSGTPTGTAVLYGGASGTQFVDSHALDNTGMATWTSALLPGGSYSVKAHYAGDGNFGSSDSAAIAVNISHESSVVFPNLVTLDVRGNPTSFAASGATYGSGYFLFRVDIGNSGATVSPATGISSTCSTHISSCPTGTVAVTANGTPLGGGSMVLNNEGFAENQSLAPGTYAISTTYPGDSSYAASMGTANFTIAKAPTSVSAGSPEAAQYGNSTQIAADVQTSSNGIEPTGTLIFSVDGSPATGPVGISAGGPYDPNTSPPSFAAAYAQATTTFLSVGSHTLSAQYSGDAYYASATSPPTIIVVSKAYPFFTTWGASPSSVNLNQQVILSARLYGSQAGALPTGTITFEDGDAPISGPVTYTSDSGLLLGTIPYAPTTPGTHNISVSYSGDGNYQPLGYTGPAVLTVLGPVSVTPSGNIVITSPGGSGSTTLVISSNAGFVGMVNLSCVLDPNAAESSCGFGSGSSSSPTTQVNLTGSSVNVTFNVTTTGAHSQRSLQAVASFAGVGLVGIFLLGMTGTRTGRPFLSLLTFALALSLGGCGGGAGSASIGGANLTDPGTRTGTYTFTITSTTGTGSSAISLSTPVTVTVQ